MISFPSRSEKRELALYRAAEKGEFSLEKQIVYSSEIRTLRKKGFEVTEESIFDKAKGLYVVSISWAHAYLKIPQIVFAYMTGIINTKPIKHIGNPAQQLYVIAYRVSNKG